MNPVHYVKRTPTPEEFVVLRTDAGWGIVEEPALSESLGRTLFAVCAETGDGQTVGMARVVGDGGLQVFVTDVIVLTEWRNQGIGTEMMRLVTDHIQESASPRCFVGLFSARGRESFYKRFGFFTRPNEKLGAGMNLSRKRPD